MNIEDFLSQDEDLEGMDDRSKMERVAQIVAQIKKHKAYNKIDSYHPYKKQREFHALSKDHNQILFMAGNQQGKSLVNGSLVLTPTGYIPIEHLKVGDRVIAGDGSPTEVTGVYPQGVVPLFRLTFDQGEQIVCCGEHLWKFRKFGDPAGSWRVANTNAILAIDGAFPAMSKRVGMPHVDPDRLMPSSMLHILCSIEHDEPGEATCISVDHPDRTFVIEHGIVTHNTYSGAAECTYHATGVYPSWWEGKRFPYPVHIICGSTTFEMTQAGIQKNLLGPPTDREAWGTWSLPASSIGKIDMAAAPKNMVQTILVKHASGLGNSTIKLTCYSKGRESWQAAKADFVWFDEEPPFDVFDEGITRLSVGSGPDFGFPDMRGYAICTFTPLLGMSRVVNSFYPVPATPNKAYVRMGIHDVEHHSPERKAAMLAEYPEHMREARANGIPMLGEGAIFNVDWKQVLCKPIEILPHYFIINGIDFGFDHPSAGVSIAHDRDTDTIYVTNCVKARKQSSGDFASLIRLWKGAWAWPHDGAQHDKGSGETLADQYTAHGIDMLPVRATHDGKSNSLEASIQDVLSRFLEGRLRIFEIPANEPLLDELRQYHRKEGKPVAVYDDAISAMRYAIMMSRFATQDKARQTVVERYRFANQRKQNGFGSSGSGNSSYMAK